MECENCYSFGVQFKNKEENHEVYSSVLVVYNCLANQQVLIERDT